MSHPVSALVVSDVDRVVLERTAKAVSLPARKVIRARVLLAAADGVSNAEIARRQGLSVNTVKQWRARFADQGLEKFAEVRAGRGRKPTIGAAQIDEIVRMTVHEKPVGETHWSCRTMAKAAGVSPATVQRIWSGRGLKPHLVDTFKLSTDPRFEEKLADVVGLYMSPPERAVVLCVDEKTQVQALDRTQPSLPIKPGRAATMTHDYKRNGTTCLFAALDAATGQVIGQCQPKHTNAEFIKFLDTIDAAVPNESAVHLVMDNYATHGHANVQAWLDAHPRFVFHFTPTSSSWLNLVERWFRELTDKALRRGSFTNVPELETAIHAYLDAHNDQPKPFIWTATTKSIITKVKRGRVALNTSTKLETHH